MEIPLAEGPNLGPRDGRLPALFAFNRELGADLIFIVVGIRGGGACRIGQGKADTRGREDKGFASPQRDNL